MTSIEKHLNRFDQETDDRLVELARTDKGEDTRPFEALVRRHQGFVVANCRVITRSAADAEDLAQEVFVKAFFGLRRFEGRAQFRTWLQRIKVNHCLNHLRKTRKAVMVDIDDVTPEDQHAMRTPPNAHVELQAAGDRERIVSVLDAMPDTLRIPLMLRDGDGLSYEEIAAQLGIGLSAVKMRIKRARDDFRIRFAGASPRPGAPAGAPVEVA
jgi:RNA polymerase sigma-70 factor (ECF subfamily)